MIGAGRCGLQLARAIAAAGLELVGVAARSPRSRRRAARLLDGVAVTFVGAPHPRATNWLFAVPDDVLPGLAADLARTDQSAPRVAVHTSGVLGSDALAPLRGSVRGLGSFHPLLSFPSAEGALVSTAGALAAIEGDAAGLAACRSLARALAMRPLRLTADAKPRYHAAAVLAANLTHALVAEARSQFASCGVPPRVAVAALKALTASAVGAALEARGWERLTGPLTRGDVASLRAHLAALPPRVATVYRAVSALAVHRLSESGLIDETTARQELVALTEPDRYASFGPDEGS